MARTKMINSRKLMDKILRALKHKKPLSVISVGATESFVMAQYTVMSEEEFMNHPEAYIANQGMKSGFEHRGIRFPNIQTRDEVVEAVQKADIIGYNTIVQTMNGGQLTEKVFEAYKIKPRYIFEANLRRVLMFSQKEKFEKMLKDKKILLISSIADKAKEGMETTLKDKLDFDIVGTISIFEYEEIPRVKEEIANYDFDLCLIAAGTNALILATHIAEKHGKVAIDIGSGMNSLYTGEVVTDEWLTDIIGLDRLMEM
ncbi:GT-D fold domain-containing glycosyltransferase [Mesobacillus harenae]|uniref:GT-D fold domain-containing glycosyltransferase n=1 Tax=Mesobacillus harenae TaxID=2213203 RepID=UPI0015806056|nr:GT-D fold domain-containing glycosyltransferase [Mesobacillus harenae]